MLQERGVRVVRSEQSCGGAGGGGDGGGGDGGGGEGGGGDGGGGDGGDGGGEQSPFRMSVHPANRKLRPVVQHAVIAYRTWKCVSGFVRVPSIITNSARASCWSVSESPYGITGLSSPMPYCDAV